ncbi:hypothetical protein DV495_001287 [Geotrichum candidum]|uniref:Mediator of RNA polymerase II transcription subunit 18 n=1 Tax=Geotrichum candidum TaxID=1173061 RepID=A0A0J9XGD7_GEOCN|nr:hypothetical protein DV452_001983 [Geotrichum candidum]KAI9210491.1 hypothetical protein DS838_004634 [Geotrichum bryndzae]KAF5132482.1 hypothetical protein DV495_001287 [Geotrichum candidum]KAF7500832.1 hypothetical protein DV113_001142 [Geotrichum candidum]KAI8135053.1 hypothetical protein DUD61_001282 [Geotrichum candidum]
MPQQLSLYSSVADADLKISLHTLVSLTGQKPNPIFNHNLIFTPRPVNPANLQQQQQQHELYRMRLSRKVETVSQVIPYAKLPASPDRNYARWTAHVAELPEAGKRKVVSQALLSTVILDDEPFSFVGSLGYEYGSEYWIKGYQFIYNDTITIHLFRLCVFNTATDTLELLDKSGKWIVKAYSDVALVTDIEGINAATAALETLKTDLSGLFDLVQPERNCFETRMKRVR